MTIYKTITTTSLVIVALSRCAAFVPSPFKYDIVRPSPLSQEQQPAAFLMRLAYMDKDDVVKSTTTSSDSISSTVAKAQSASAHKSIEQFLTQRSVQTFLFRLKECHDPHTARWIEDFTEAKNLLSYHGTEAFSCERFPGWDSLLSEMMAQPPDVMVLDIENHLNGLSKNNPYRKKESVRRTITIDIEPPSLAGRILSVRESLSREWTQDLEQVISANNNIISSYNEKFADSNIEMLPNGISPVDATKLVNKKHYEKHHAFESGSNFDVLFLLATQESVHRVLNNFMAAVDDTKVTSHRWLLEYYSQNADKYFDKNQKYSRANEFVDNLLRTLPYTINKDGNVDLIDPLLIAEEIIRVRGEVASEWKNMMSLVPDSHTDIRKDVFMRQMSTWIQHFVDEPSVVVTEMDDAIEEASCFQ